MKRFARCRVLLLGAVAIVWGGLGVGSSRAAEEARKFLDALRENGYYDTALDYLEMARTDPLVPKEFKTTIDYEAGVTLIEGARTERVMRERASQLDRAQQMLKQFTAGHGGHPLAPGANTQLANVLVERGRMKVEQSDEEKRTAAEKQQFREEARALYTEAEKVFENLENEFLEQHKEYPKFIDEKKEPEKYEEREQVRRDLLQARLALGTVLYEKAQTFEPGTEEHKKNLEKSAERYHQMYEKYGARLAGLYARMFEGRCFKELGQHDKAFDCFEELLTYEDPSPPFQGLKNKTFVFYLQTCLDTKGKERAPRLKKAVENTLAWAKQAARGPYENTPEGLAIKFLGGKAALEIARGLEGPENASEKRDLLKSARRWFTDVEKMPGEYQTEAGNLLYSEELAGKEGERPEPQSFMECVDRGKKAMGRSQEESLSEEKRAEARQEAIDYYHRAMNMKTEETTAEEMNILRYYLSFLYFMEKKYYEAAVMGEFLARKYPSGVGARQGAKIAMAAYVTLFNEAPENDRQFEDDRMTGIARYITETWEDQPEADEAWMMLINNALRNEELGKAAEYLQHISATSPRRSDAELMTGQKMWAAYLEASRKPEGQRPAQARLDAMVDAAQKTLEDGINRMRERVEGGEISYTLVASVLSMAQICIGSNQPEKAVKWLEDPKVGALTLVKAESPITDRGNFRSETYKAALRAFVATKRLDDAEEVMKRLEDSITKGGDADAQKKLTQIYISLGRELEDMLQRLRAEGKNEEAAAVSDGFVVFLDQISKRGAQGNTFASLNWVAETFVGLGAGFDVGGTLPARAKEYYGKARDTYLTILKLVKDGKIEAPPGAERSIQIRLARCRRRLGEFSDAQSLLLGILKESQMVIDAQIEAAYTYQAWGEETPGYYKYAIVGSKNHREIWGWGGLSQRVARLVDPDSERGKKFSDIFHEARYNLALCRLRLAQNAKGTEQSELLERAQKDITVVQRLYPDMGGPEWYEKYDELLRKIQKLRGKTATGLKGTAELAEASE